MNLTQSQLNKIQNAKGNQARLLIWFQEIKPTITAWQAWQYLGISQVADPVRYLRKKGYNITTEELKVNNRFMEKRNIGRYRFNT